MTSTTQWVSSLLLDSGASESFLAWVSERSMEAMEAALGAPTWEAFLPWRERKKALDQLRHEFLTMREEAAALRQQQERPR